MIRRHASKARRSGIVLLVVISLLALFSALGLTFVFYADSEATTASNNKGPETQFKADADPELLLALWINQLLYGTGDAVQPYAGSPYSLYSALRGGHDLSRNMYGLNSLAATPNTFAYGGVGKIGPVPPGFFPLGTTYADLVNMTYWPSDGFILDPERQGPPRPGPAAPILAGYVGWNPPYTYPDKNNLFLGAMNANGEILAPSWWRSWSTFGPIWVQNATNTGPVLNPNFTSTAPFLKYLTMRPHQSVNPFFPLPLDGGGDVKNVEFGPGLRNPLSGQPGQPKYFANDSIWMDIDAPIMVGPDGRKYKALFATFIVDMDGKINLNAAGNIRGAGNVNASSMGQGPWEINPAYIINQGDYANLFLGNGTFAGRYGSSGVPGAKGASASLLTATQGGLLFSNAPQYQLGLDQDGVLNNGTFTLSSKYKLPGEYLNLNSAYFGFTGFPAPASSTSYGTYGQSPLSARELLAHPNLFNILNPSYGNSTNTVFADSIAEAFYRNLGSGSEALTALPYRLCPASMSDPTGQTRRLLTPRSFDLAGVPGAMPWLAGLAGNYQLTPTTTYPTAPPQPFPPPPPPGGVLGGEFGPGLNYSWFLQRKINLNRPLTAYPPAPINTASAAGMTAYSNALKDRQALAQDIFNVFLQVAMGIPINATTNLPTSLPPVASPPSANYLAAQWLAQLSVNIVDYIDSDNYSTPWNWNPADPNGGWVYGTELPRLVLNEAYAQVQNDPTDPLTIDPKTKLQIATKPYHLDMWVELHNTMKADPNIVDPITLAPGAVRLEMPPVFGNLSYPIYTLTATQGAPSFTNQQLGTPTGTSSTVVQKYSLTGASSPVQLVQPVAAAPNDYFGPNGGNGGFYVVGPNDAFPGGKVAATLASPNMTFSVPLAAPAFPNVNFYLQRLACPDLPPQPVSTKPYYNPYVTVDYISGIQSWNALSFNQNGPVNNSTPVPNRFSVGKKQPYAAAQLVAQQPAPLNATQPQHTFFRHNAIETATAPKNTGPKQTLTLPFNWLVHPDRQVVSPMELLHVSAYPPYQLTQQFMGAALPAPPFFGHMSMPAWFDSQARIYRALEFFETGQRATAVDVYGQVIPLTGRNAGKININTYWDPQILLALADPQTNVSTFTQAQVNALHTKLMSSRTPLGVPGPSDRPFVGMAPGFIPPGDPNYPAGLSIDYTLLRGATPNMTSAAINANPAGSRLLSNNVPVNIVAGKTLAAAGALNMNATNNTAYTTGGAPPFVKMELLNKLYNNVTTRSNVFAMWVTVGFFDVTDGPITTLAAQANAGSAQITVANNQGSVVGVPWVIKPGVCIWVDGEPVNVTGVAGNTITLQRPLQGAHAANAAVSMKGVLGQEVNASEGRNTRHRMFAVIDRSGLSIPNNLTSTMSPILGQKPTLPAPPTQLPLGFVKKAYPTQKFGPFAGTVTLSDWGAFANAGLKFTQKVVAGKTIVTVGGTPVMSGNAGFGIAVTSPLGVTTTTYYVIPVAMEVPVQQVQGVATLNYPAPANTPIGPSFTVNYSWQIKPGVAPFFTAPGSLGTTLAVDVSGPNQETIEVLYVNQTKANTVTAIFYKSHANGVPLTLSGQTGIVPGSILGNPGPQPQFDHRLNSALVPHYSIIK